MSQQFLKPLARGVGTGSPVTIYTVPTGTRGLIKACTVANPTTAVVVLVVTVQQDPLLDGGVFRAAIPGLALGTLQTSLCPELINQMLNAGGQIQLTGNGLEFLVSGVEIIQ